MSDDATPTFTRDDLDTIYFCVFERWAEMRTSKFVPPEYVAKLRALLDKVSSIG